MGSTQEADIAGPVFHLFPQLPTELRLQVWSAALPAAEHDERSVFTYHRNCWKRCTLEIPGKSSRDEKQIRTLFEFDTQLLGHVRVRLPALGQVNRESRKAVMDWACRLDGVRMSKIRCLSDKDGVEYVEYAPTRPFDARLDMLLVEYSMVDVLRKDVVELLESADYESARIVNGVKAIAARRESLTTHWIDWLVIRRGFPHIETYYVVVSEQSIQGEWFEHQRDGTLLGEMRCKEHYDVEGAKKFWDQDEIDFESRDEDEDENLVSRARILRDVLGETPNRSTDLPWKYPPDICGKRFGDFVDDFDSAKTYIAYSGSYAIEICAVIAFRC